MPSETNTANVSSAVSSSDIANNYCINLENILQASQRIKHIVHKTPVLTSSSLNHLLHKNNINNNKNDSNQKRQRLFFKVEAMQRTGSFKFRGACNAVLALLENDVNVNADNAAAAENCNETIRNYHVVTHSSGNHAAALALAAKVASSTSKQKCHVKATIVMPKNAPLIKVNAVQDSNGHIIKVESTNEARENKADEILLNDKQATFIHPSENEYVIAGQGTVCLEMVEQVRNMLKEESKREASFDEKIYEYLDCDLDVVIIPVGGGGLASGNTIALRGLLGDKIKIVLAEPMELDDAKRSKEAGILLGHHEDNQLNSCADGLKTTLGANTWPIVRDLVDDVITVSEVDILHATKLIWERLKVMIEPSAGVGVAVALSNEFRDKYRVENGIQNVGVILCGGNVDILKVTKLMEEQGI